MSDPFVELEAEIAEKTARDYEAATGHKPEHDDMTRVNCPRAGQPGHLMCGWCNDCNKPVYICGHHP